MAPRFSRLVVGALTAASALTDCTAARDAAPTKPPPAVGPTAEVDPSQRVAYVPAYSHISTREGSRTMLAITLSVRNIDHAATVTLTAVDYFNTQGTRVRRYLDAPVQLKPLATAEYYVEPLDDTGGSGANFLVQWNGPANAQPLLTESIMTGHAGSGYISFASRGVELHGTPSGQ